MERARLSEQLDRQEVEHKDGNKGLRADVAKLEVKVQEYEKQTGEQKHLIGRLEKQVSVEIMWIKV